MLVVSAGRAQIKELFAVLDVVAFDHHLVRCLLNQVAISNFAVWRSVKPAGLSCTR